MDHMLMTYLEGLSKQMAELKAMIDRRLPLPGDDHEEHLRVSREFEMSLRKRAGDPPDGGLLTATELTARREAVTAGHLGLQTVPKVIEGDDPT
jgi:hypothetical protein